MSTTLEQHQIPVYEAWKDILNDDEDKTPEQFEQAFIGEFYGDEELGEYVAENMASVDEFWEGRGDHPLAGYFKFDYAMYGRDLQIGGDVYSIKIKVPMGTAGHMITRTYYFWTNV